MSKSEGLMLGKDRKEVSSNPNNLEVKELVPTESDGQVPISPARASVTVLEVLMVVIG